MNLKKIKVLLILFFAFVFISSIKSYAGEFSLDKDKYTIFSEITIDVKFQDGDEDSIQEVIPDPNDGLMDISFYDNYVRIYNNNRDGDSKIYAVKIGSKQGYEKNFIVKLLNREKIYNLVFNGGFVGQTRNISEALEADDLYSIVPENENIIRITGDTMEFVGVGDCNINYSDEKNHSNHSSVTTSVHVAKFNSFGTPDKITRIPMILNRVYASFDIDVDFGVDSNDYAYIGLNSDEAYVEDTKSIISIYQNEGSNGAKLYFHFNYQDVTPGIKKCVVNIPGIINTSFEVEFYLPIEEMKLNRKSLTMEQGESFKLEKILTPVNSEPENINRYSSSDETVATVDQDGTVTALKTGIAVITAEVDGYNYSGQPPKSMIISYDCTVLVLGKQLQVTTLNVISLLKFNTKTPISNVVTKDNFPILNENYNVKVLSKTGVEKTNEDNIGSRDQIVVTSPENEEVTTFTAVVKGDVSGNGLTKVYDAYQVLNQSISNNELDEINSYAMDYNDDGDVKIYDAYKFLNVAISQ